MKIREKIGSQPAWKVMIAFLLVVGFLFIGIEEIFISTVFSAVDSLLTHFEKDFKDDVDDMNSMLQEDKEEKEYMRLEHQLHNWESTISDNSTQTRVCNYQRDTRILEKQVNLVYLKNRDGLRKAKADHIASNKKYIEDQIFNNGYDPAKCQDSQS